MLAGVLATGALAACDDADVGTESRAVQFRQPIEVQPAEDSMFIFIVDGENAYHSTAGGDEWLLRFTAEGTESPEEDCRFEGNTLVRDGVDLLVLSDDGKRVFDGDEDQLYKFAGPNILGPTGAPIAFITQNDKPFNILRGSTESRLLLAALVHGVCGSAGL